MIIVGFILGWVTCLAHGRYRRMMMSKVARAYEEGLKDAGNLKQKI